jgi:hypothetical protein
VVRIPFFIQTSDVRFFHSKTIMEYVPQQSTTPLDRLRRLRRRRPRGDPSILGRTGFTAISCFIAASGPNASRADTILSPATEATISTKEGYMPPLSKTLTILIDTSTVGL